MPKRRYHIDVATGGLDLESAAVVSDVAAWRGEDGLRAPKTPVGFIATALHRRRRAGLGAFTVLSCDNLPLNGDMCKRVTLDFARAVDAELAAWINANASFPNSMVDRSARAASAEAATLSKASSGE